MSLLWQRLLFPPSRLLLADSRKNPLWQRGDPRLGNSLVASRSDPRSLAFGLGTWQISPHGGPSESCQPPVWPSSSCFLGSGPVALRSHREVNRIMGGSVHVSAFLSRVCLGHSLTEWMCSSPPPPHPNSCCLPDGRCIGANPCV